MPYPTNRRKRRRAPARRRGRLITIGTLIAVCLVLLGAIWFLCGANDPARPYGLSKFKPGDTLEALVAALPVQTYEEQPDDYVLFFAKDRVDGVPVPPYAVLLPAGDMLRVYVVSPLAQSSNSGSLYTVGSFWIDPDTEAIQSIEWTASDHAAFPLPI